MRHYAYSCGLGGRARELVELAVVNVQQLVAPACDFEPCRTQEKRPQAIEGLAASGRRGDSQPLARLVV